MRKVEYLVFLGIAQRQEVMDLAKFVDTARHSNSTDYVGFKFSWTYSMDLDTDNWLLAVISYGKFYFMPHKDSTQSIHWRVHIGEE